MSKLQPTGPDVSDATELQWLREQNSHLHEQVRNLKRSEETIRRNNAIFDALLESSKDGIALARSDGSIIRVIKSILGYAPDISSGISIYDVVHPEDRAMMHACYEQLLIHGAHQAHHELRMRRSDGSYIWIEGTVTDMIGDPNVLAFVHNYREVTGPRHPAGQTQPEGMQCDPAATSANAVP